MSNRLRYRFIEGEIFEVEYFIRVNFKNGIVELSRTFVTSCEDISICFGSLNHFRSDSITVQTVDHARFLTCMSERLHNWATQGTSSYRLLHR